MRGSHADRIAKGMVAGANSFREVPGVMLPGQVSEPAPGLAWDAPERRLAFAVLLDAIVQLRRRDTAAARDVARWIRDKEGDADAPFSFRGVCESLGLEPTYLARGLLAAESLQRLLDAPGRRLRISRQRVTPTRQRRRAAIGRTALPTCAQVSR